LYLALHRLLHAKLPHKSWPTHSKPTRLPLEMPTRKKSTKRELENPGDVSISAAPAASKKSKGQAKATTRLSAKQAASSADVDQDGDVDSPAVPSLPIETEAPKKTRPCPKMKTLPSSELAKEPGDDEVSSLSSTRLTKQSRAKTVATAVDKGKRISPMPEHQCAHHNDVF
jgi:hypothetical protein